MDEEYWCMQWSGEVLPEAAMIPDLGIFLRSSAACAQTVTAGGCDAHRAGPRDEVREELLTQAREKFPARLKLPFVLSPAYASPQTDPPGASAGSPVP